MSLPLPNVFAGNGFEANLPIYFPSVSSVKTALMPEEYIGLLAALSSINSQYLVSAFDLARVNSKDQVASALASSREAGGVLLMDSGNYESFWKDARDCWAQDHFHKILSDFPCDIAFGFDEQSPPSDTGKHIELIVSRWRLDQSAAGCAIVVPIVHGAAEELPKLCAAVADKTGVKMIAVPERRLGNGFLERASAVSNIRRELNSIGRYVPLHLLGTGNPVSIAVYSAMGADSFDGLEWCQTVVDHDSGLLYHFSQADLFSAQTDWGDEEVSFQARTLAHNLEFYASWMSRIQRARSQGCLMEFLRYNLPERVFMRCSGVLRARLS